MRKDVVGGVENGPWLEQVVALHYVVMIVRVHTARDVEALLGEAIYPHVKTSLAQCWRPWCHYTQD